jgi:hypothetical protein
MNDAGNYSCAAQNMFGSEEITYVLEVKRNFTIKIFIIILVVFKYK